MNITPIQLAKRIEKWQQRLQSLGVGHTRIECVSLVDQTPGGSDAKATVQPSREYDSAHFWFTHDFIKECTESELDETIVHEWVHVAMRDLDVAIEADVVEDFLPKFAHEVWADRVDHEREGFVDKIAREIYRQYLSGQ